MPLAFEPYNHNPLVHGCNWKVVDEDVLAREVAQILLGRHVHLRSIITGRNPNPLIIRQSDVRWLKDVLAVKKGNKASRWQRDGLVFQAISWIAYAHNTSAASILSTPQTALADKGFDGLAIERAADANSFTVVIWEDKASRTPKKLLASQIWPAIKSIEAGARDRELVSEVSAMLRGQMKDEEVERTIEHMNWRVETQFRITLAVGSDMSNQEACRKLFGRYRQHVKGAVARRRGDTVAFQDLRTWMSQFSLRVLEAGRSMVVVKPDV